MSTKKESSDMVDELQIRLYGPDGKLKDKRDSKVKIRWYHYLTGLIILIPWLLWQIIKKVRKLLMRKSS